MLSFSRQNDTLAILEATPSFQRWAGPKGGANLQKAETETIPDKLRPDHQSPVFGMSRSIEFGYFFLFSSLLAYCVLFLPLKIIYSQKMNYLNNGNAPPFQFYIREKNKYYMVISCYIFVLVFRLFCDEYDIKVNIYANDSLY